MLQQQRNRHTVQRHPECPACDGVRVMLHSHGFSAMLWLAPILLNCGGAISLKWQFLPNIALNGRPDLILVDENKVVK